MRRGAEPDRRMEEERAERTGSRRARARRSPRRDPLGQPAAKQLRGLRDQPGQRWRERPAGRARPPYRDHRRRDGERSDQHGPQAEAAEAQPQQRIERVVDQLAVDAPEHRPAPPRRSAWAARVMPINKGGTPPAPERPGTARRWLGRGGGRSIFSNARRRHGGEFSHFFAKCQADSAAATPQRRARSRGAVSSPHNGRGEALPPTAPADRRSTRSRRQAVPGGLAGVGLVDQFFERPEELGLRPRRRRPGCRARARLPQAVISSPGRSSRWLPVSPRSSATRRPAMRPPAIRTAAARELGAEDDLPARRLRPSPQETSTALQSWISPRPRRCIPAAEIDGANC